MKKIVTLLLGANFSLAFTQITLDSSNFPLAGVSYNRFICVGGNPGNAGANQLYDFSNILIWINDTVRYVNPATTPYASFHPGANIALLQPGNGIMQILYYTSDSNAFWLSGSTLLGDFGMGFTVTHANHPFLYTDTLISNQYTYGHAEAEVSGIRFQNIYPGLDYQTISVKNIFCDGYGTIYAPLDTFANVLRVKYIEYRIDTVFSNNVPVDDTTETFYYYKYFAQGIRHPVVIAHTDSVDKVQYIEVLVMPYNLNGCTDSLAQNFNPIANQNDGSCIYCNQITYTISSDTSVCEGDTVVLNASGASNFLWSTGDTVSSVMIHPDSMQTYSVYMNYQSYCWQIASATVSVYEDVQAGFWPDMTNPNDGDTILFVNTSTNAITYFWDFGDSATSTEKNPRHLYTTTGAKTITLIASNPCSTDTVLMTIVFAGDEELLAPSFILHVYPNPSVDGKFNVQCIPAGQAVSMVNAQRIEIRNVLGQLVYQQNISPRSGRWNIELGTDVPQGIYIVRLKAGAVFYQQKIIKM